ncbi:hypothetical protein Tco_1378992 [Tanacetum coccineum]
MKKLADIYFTCVTQMVESTFSLSTRQMALWKSQMEEHTSDWLRVVLISGLGQTINNKTYRCVLGYWLGVLLIYVPKPCSACSKVFAENIYGDHVVSCTGIVGIKHRHNIVRNKLVNICFRSEISAGKEIDIGLYLTEIGYGFLLFSFSSFGELERDAVTLLKWIRKFFVTQDIGARTTVHIFSRISFAIARGVGAQIHLCSSKVAYARVAMRRGWTNEEIMRFNVQVK